MTSRELYASRYLEVEIGTANPLQLVVMLYDGAVKYLREAIESLHSGDIEGRTAAINRTLAIVSELQATLNFEDGGQVARALESLYAYMKGRMIAANLGQEEEPLSEVISLLSTLRSAWQELASLGLNPPAASALPEHPLPAVPSRSAAESRQPGSLNLSC